MNVYLLVLLTFYTPGWATGDIIATVNRQGDCIFLATVMNQNLDRVQKLICLPATLV